MKVAFCTLGCKVNQYDTQAMRELFEDAGYTCVDFEEPADVYVVNTCAVTQTGEKKSRQMISRAHGQNPEAAIIVAGCYAQRAAAEILQLPGVRATVGIKDRAKIVALAASLQDMDAHVDLVGDLQTAHSFESLTASREGRTRAHLKIQEGCDRFCSYCIIPYVRGPIRSRPLEEIRAELAKLAAAGYLEVVLTGIHLMSYGRDLGDNTNLLDAIAQAEGIKGIRRIRLGSLEPQMLDDAFIAALAANPRICHHFHLSMQSGSRAVLARMNRRYTPEDYLDCVHRLRAAMPGCAITTDVIAGFPGESEEEHAETMAFVEAVGFSRLHVFPYSRREGTKAYSMPGQLPRSVKAARASALIALGKRMEAYYLESFPGKTVEVLFEERAGCTLQGYTDSYAQVWVESDDDSLCGGIPNVMITGAADGHLVGII